MKLEVGKRYKSRRGYPRDLVEELPDSQTKELLMTKAQTLSNLIDQIPVCSDGKSKIRALVQELSGEALAPQAPPPAMGQIWLYEDSPRMLIRCRGEAVVSLDGCLSPSHAWDAAIQYYGYTFAANSLAEYLAKGGKL